MSAPKFPTFQYAQMDDGGDESYVCVYDEKDEASEECLREGSVGPYIGIYQLVGVEQVTQQKKYKYKAVVI